MKLLRLSLICLFGGLILSGCVKRKFDTPPNSSDVDPYLPVNSTVENFATSALGLGANQSRLLGDSTFVCVVVADDKSGNLYKKIIVEDTLGYGMTIIIDKNSLYGDFPVGRRLYVKTKGLFLVNYKGIPELVYNVNADNSTNGLPTSLISNFLIKGSFPHYIQPKVVDVIDLFSNPYPYVNTLVKIENMQFDALSSGVVYSNSTASTNRTITNCDKTVKMTMYNSNYATFQPAITPTGNGTITGIFSVYISTPQFTLRDTTDVQFTNPRCP